MKRPCTVNGSSHLKCAPASANVDGYSLRRRFIKKVTCVCGDISTFHIVYINDRYHAVLFSDDLEIVGAALDGIVNTSLGRRALLPLLPPDLVVTVPPPSTTMLLTMSSSSSGGGGVRDGTSARAVAAAATTPTATSSSSAWMSSSTSAWRFVFETWAASKHSLSSRRVLLFLLREAGQSAASLSLDYMRKAPAMLTVRGVAYWPGERRVTALQIKGCANMFGTRYCDSCASSPRCSRPSGSTRSLPTRCRRPERPCARAFVRACV